MSSPSTVPFSEDENGHIFLNAVECKSCGHVSFPFQTFDCERCGATDGDLREKPIQAKGILQSFVAVPNSLGGSIEAPFIIGSIVFKEGVTVRCTLIEREESLLRHGESMIACLIDVDGSEGETREEIRFRRETVTP